MRPPEETSDVSARYVVASKGSVQANLDDLRLLGTELDGIATTAIDAAGTSLSIEWALPLRGDILSPGTAATCAGSSVSLSASLTAASVRAGGLSALITATVSAYELAEQSADDAIERARAVYVLGSALAKITVADATGKPVPPEVTADIVTSGIGLLDSIVPGSYSTTMLITSAVALSVAGPTRPVTTTLVAGPESLEAPRAARTIGESMGVVTTLYDKGDKAAHIQVQRVVDPATGQGRWTVMLPGTSSWGYDADTPLDLSGNLIAASGQVSPAERAVEEALQDAMRREGVAGKGEPVMVVGHSQGGMVMTNLARHAKDLNITRIVTYGSPVGTTKVPGRARALNVENRADTVPGMDGMHTGDGDPRRIRMIINDPTAKIAANGSESVVEAHNYETYHWDYEACMDRARNDPNHPAAVFERESAVFFAGQAHAYRYDATRGPAPTPQANAAGPRQQAASTRRGDTGQQRPLTVAQRRVLNSVINPGTGPYRVTSP